MWTCSWLALASCCLLLVTGPGLGPCHALAQEPFDTPAYEALVDEGIREYGLGNFLEARSLLMRAHEQCPNARALRAIGMVEFELRNYAASASALEAALASEVRPLSELQREQAENLRRRAENFLTHVAVFSSPWPSQVSVDGQRVELPQGGELVLEVGEHELVFAAPGYLAERRHVRAVGNEWLLVQVSLQTILVTPFAAQQVERLPQRAGEQRADMPVGASSKQRWIWTSVLLVSAVLATGLGFGLSAREQRERAPLVADPIAVRRGP